MITTQLPAGLTGTSAEMYSVDNTLMCVAGGISLPVVKSSRIRNKVFRHMANRPTAHKSVIEWVGNNEDDQINQYGQCLWGSFNMVPDVDDAGNLTSPELVQCTNRGNCKYENVICKCFQVNENVFLSKTEERLIPHILWADRIIGQMLNVSPFTITTHIKNIKSKLNIQTKAQLVDWAKDNGIKLCK